MKGLALILMMLAAPAVAEEAAAPAHGEDGEKAEAATIEPINIEDVLKPPSGVETLAIALARLQDAAATGNAGSGSLQRRTLVEMSKAFRQHDPHTLPSPRTLRAAIIYLLSGGRPGDVEPLLVATPETEPLRWIIKGAAHYAAYEPEAASKALAPFDPQRLPLSIGGRVALARAMVLPDGEDAERVRLLRLAGRLMPGTLVEESSLRRLLPIAVGLGEPQPAQYVIGRYIERFGHSIYAANVLEQYAAAIVAFEVKAKPVARQSVELLFNQLPVALRRDTYLAIARAAVLRGLADLALFSASRARRLATEDSIAWHAATLYDAAILVVSPDYVIAVDLLHQVDAAKLDFEGKELLAASLRIAAAIRRPETPPAPGERQTEVPETQAQLLSKAQKVLLASEELLKDLTQ